MFDKKFLTFSDPYEWCSTEDLYQAFKERLIKELVVISEELLYTAEIIDAVDPKQDD